MKIVHIITRLILGGAQENTLITCRLLAEHGHDVTLITGPALGPEGHLYDWTRNSGFETIVVDEMRREIAPRLDRRAYKKIKRLLTELKPDIVHTHSAKAGILGRFAAHRLKGKFGKPGFPKVVHTIHGLAFHDYQAGHLNALYIAIERAAAKRTDAMLTVADTMSEKALAAKLGTPDMYTTAYSAIEEDAYLAHPGQQRIADFRRKYGLSSESVVLATVARLAELKGHEYIIESAKKLASRFPDCTWLFVGDGHLRSDLQQQIQLANLSYRFKFAGMVDPSDIPMVMHASDILVHCSLREGLARALPQAMLAGKPVVSFDIDGAKEVVTPETGRLIPPEDVPALTEACAELIADPNLRRQLGQNARKKVTKQFAPETMVDTIESLYRKLV
ncbi:Glycosyltransferase KanE [Anaerohalosphaera lusitana]|uniref:Glycosyltransferase KanE n=1 Tax=Anaerohalosphaera lusitana TaxID=1936003 RepID=A0A1U9NQI4_9BACT|nr:glycosyltransferase family 4 protein [Anaerohalosphaera lusitana]AQT70192.1 Glycosyltransferase KanE [Anaerohalosphaera lusitana]